MRAVLGVVVLAIGLGVGGYAYSINGDPVANADTAIPVPPAAPVVIEPPMLVQSILDGASFRLIDGREIRLAQVVAPAIEQCFGPEARRALSAIIAGKEVALRKPGDAPALDANGRHVYEVQLDGRSVNEMIVRDGGARFDLASATGDPDLTARLQAAQTAAQGEGLGIWKACPAT